MLLFYIFLSYDLLFVDSCGIILHAKNKKKVYETLIVKDTRLTKKIKSLFLDLKPIDWSSRFGYFDYTSRIYGLQSKQYMLHSLILLSLEKSLVSYFFPTAAIERTIDNKRKRLPVANAVFYESLFCNPISSQGPI